MNPSLGKTTDSLEGGGGRQLSGVHRRTQGGWKEGVGKSCCFGIVILSSAREAINDCLKGWYPCTQIIGWLVCYVFVGDIKILLSKRFQPIDPILIASFLHDAFELVGCCLVFHMDRMVPNVLVSEGLSTKSILCLLEVCEFFGPPVLHEQAWPSFFEVIFQCLFSGVHKFVYLENKFVDGGDLCCGGAFFQLLC